MQRPTMTRNRDTLFLLGGAALMVFGAGLILSTPVVRRVPRRRRTSAASGAAAVPDLERYLKLRPCGGDGGPQCALRHRQELQQVHGARVCQRHALGVRPQSRRSPFAISRRGSNSRPTRRPRASLRLKIRAASLEVTDDIKSKDRHEMESTMNRSARNREVSRDRRSRRSGVSANQLSEGRYQAQHRTAIYRCTARRGPVAGAGQVTLIGDMLRASRRVSVAANRLRHQAGQRGRRSAEIERRVEVRVRYRRAKAGVERMCLAIPGKDRGAAR